jgi:hypothetical protein
LRQSQRNDRTVHTEQPDRRREKEGRPRHLPGAIVANPKLAGGDEPGGGGEKALLVRKGRCAGEIEQIDNDAGQEAYKIRRQPIAWTQIQAMAWLVDGGNIKLT